ncbi:MAG TPA: cyclodeaminase/cyclohydrolase family protein [Solirubrobacteraceae bacterium]
MASSEAGAESRPPLPSSGRPLNEVLDHIAARAPAPGAGSSLGWAGAMAAALLEMVAGIARAEPTAERASRLRSALLYGAERELSSYQPVLDAQRRPLDDPSRANAWAAARLSASEAPLEICEAAAEVAELSAAVAAASRPGVREDALAAAVLAEACCRAAARLVTFNLRTSGERETIELTHELADRAMAAAGRAQDAWRAARSKVG